MVMGMAANPFGAHQADELSLAKSAEIGVLVSSPTQATAGTSDLGPNRWTMALTVQRSVLNFSFGIRGKLVGKGAEVTIRHNSGANLKRAAFPS